MAEIGYFLVFHEWRADLREMHSMYDWIEYAAGGTSRFRQNGPFAELLPKTVDQNLKVEVEDYLEDMKHTFRKITEQIQNQ